MKRGEMPSFLPSLPPPRNLPRHSIPFLSFSRVVSRSTLSLPSLPSFLPSFPALSSLSLSRAVRKHCTVKTGNGGNFSLSVVPASLSLSTRADPSLKQSLPSALFRRTHRRAADRPADGRMGPFSVFPPLLSSLPTPIDALHIVSLFQFLEIQE